MKQYKRLHIIKHALELYVKRPGATEKDLSQEKKVLFETNNQIKGLKEAYGINKEGD